MLRRVLSTTPSDSHQGTSGQPSGRFFAARCLRVVFLTAKDSLRSAAGAYAYADFRAALCKRQRFFVAAIILFMPSALIRRLGLGGFDLGADRDSLTPLILAHRACCAKAIFFRAATLNLRRRRRGISGADAGSTRAAAPEMSIPAAPPAPAQWQFSAVQVGG